LNVDFLERVLRHETIRHDELLIYKLTVLHINQVYQNIRPKAQNRIEQCVERAKSLKSYLKCVRFILKHKKSLLVKQLLKFSADQDFPKHRRSKRFSRSTKNLDKRPVKVQDNFVLIPDRNQGTNNTDWFRDIGRILRDTVRLMKKKSGPWFHLTKDAQQDYDDDDDKINFPSAMQKMLKTMMDSPLIKPKKKIDPGFFDHATLEKMTEEHASILSPRIFATTPRHKNSASFLSPDFLSLYRDDRQESFMPIKEVFRNLSVADHQPWYQFFESISGLDEIGRFLGKMNMSEVLKKSQYETSTGLNVPFSMLYDVSNQVMNLGQVFNMMSKSEKNFSFLYKDEVGFVIYKIFIDTAVSLH